MSKKEFYTEPINADGRNEYVKALMREFAEQVLHIAESLNKNGHSLTEEEFEIVKLAHVGKLKELQHDLTIAFISGDINRIQDIWIELEYIVRMER